MKMFEHQFSIGLTYAIEPDTAHLVGVNHKNF